MNRKPRPKTPTAGTTIHVSRTTMWNIRPNPVFAFLYNALGIPIAAGVL